ncbi:hypothetical protein IQ07DRAFT_437599 [Pyrenochaeta sp. DS3sAY3a]|nr:hypothetical protein IQ07DRAFT_437599 [Pyrenochaeta sp. DS3sAY3a]
MDGKKALALALILALRAHSGIDVKRNGTCNEHGTASRGEQSKPQDACMQARRPNPHSRRDRRLHAWCWRARGREGEKEEEGGRKERRKEGPWEDLCGMRDRASMQDAWAPHGTVWYSTLWIGREASYVSWNPPTGSLPSHAPMSLREWAARRNVALPRHRARRLDPRIYDAMRELVVGTAC